MYHNHMIIITQLRNESFIETQMGKITFLPSFLHTYILIYSNVTTIYEGQDRLTLFYLSDFSIRISKKNNIGLLALPTAEENTCLYVMK